MAANGFSTLTFTQNGLNLLAKAQAGTQLTFTRIAVGDGILNGQDASTFTALLHQVASLTIEKEIVSGTQATLTSTLSNSSLSTGFYWREIGVFAQDPQLGEILYGYANSGDGDIYVPDKGTSTFEAPCNVGVYIGTAANIIIQQSSIVYAKESEVQDIISGTTKVGAAAQADAVPASGVTGWAAAVLATVLSGLSTATSAAITAADSILTALGKLQAQITAITLAALGGSNLNLLNNPYFPNTVNQRGLTSGTAVSTAGYTLDRWKLASGSVTWTSGTGISLNGELRQYIETGVETGKTYTLSANIGGTVYSAALAASTSGASAAVTSGVTLGLKYSGSYYYFDIVTTAATTIVSVKLEKGSISTLANDAPPDFGEELRKCQRYFFDSGMSADGNSCLYSGIAANTSFLGGAAKYPVTMRIVPTISIYYKATQNHVRRITDGTEISITTPMIFGGGSRDGFSGIFDNGSTPFTAGMGYDFRVVASADL